MIRDAGYQPGIYSNRDWFINCLDLDQLFLNPDLPILPWFAHWKVNNPRFNEIGNERVAELLNRSAIWQFWGGDKNHVGTMVGSQSEGIDLDLIWGDETLSHFW
jgi:hypothetical protein